MARRLGNISRETIPLLILFVAQQKPSRGGLWHPILMQFYSGPLMQLLSGVDILSFLYFLAFLIVYRDPSKHPRLSAAERKYIRAGGATPEGPAQSGEVAMLGYLLLNRKVWGLTIGFAAYGYSFYLFLTWLPNYLEQSELALKFGFYPMGNDFAVLPYLCNFTNDQLCGHPITLFGNSGWADG